MVVREKHPYLASKSGAAVKPPAWCPARGCWCENHRRALRLSWLRFAGLLIILPMASESTEQATFGVSANYICVTFVLLNWLENCRVFLIYSFVLMFYGQVQPPNVVPACTDSRDDWSFRMNALSGNRITVAVNSPVDLFPVIFMGGNVVPGSVFLYGRDCGQS